MKILICMVVWWMAAALLAEEVVIQSISGNGTISFNEVPVALGYRIEWSSSPDEGWTNFTGTLGQWLDNIPATGEGVVTAAVPMFFRVVVAMPPPGMVLIPAGTFIMGNATNIFSPEEGNLSELPQHEVYTDAFYIDKYEVTEKKWQDVRFSSASWGYSYSNYLFAGYSEIKPMGHVAWPDALKWCNARSEMDGLTPVYYADPDFTTIYKTGTILAPSVDWSANGYRLPTEAEWEKAGRGGQPDLRFPWSDYTNRISHTKANYYASIYEEYNLSFGDHPDFPPWDLRNPVGYFLPNDYGLYDMAGNICEWVWDWYADNYYSMSPSSNPRGPETGSLRVLRGGSFRTESKDVRLSCRIGFPPDFFDYDFDSGGSFLLDMGFRCVRLP